jgi:hypothetical protein
MTAFDQRKLTAMKGTEVDNRRRFRQLSPSANRERKVADWVRQGNLELTSNGELRTKPEKRAVATPEQTYQLPDERWE